MADAQVSPQTAVFNDDILSRAVMGAALFQSYNGRRDYAKSLGYPETIETAAYWDLYQRGDLAKTLVTAYPDECWSVEPDVRDSDDPRGRPEYKPTVFEQAFQDLMDEFPSFWRDLHEADKLAGIQRFGIILIGLADGIQDLSQPVNVSEANTLSYLRPYSERCVNVAAWDLDINSRRYGMPLTYSITGSLVEGEINVSPATSVIHWSRVVHIAEEMGESRVFGTPRLQPVFNRLFDCHKVLGASAEMFWLGAFGGKAFLADKDANLTDAAKTAMKAQIQDYIHGMQRYMTMQGVTVQDLSSTPVDPTGVTKVQLQFISGFTRIPMRILLGTEQGQLAGSQDERAFRKQVATRRKNFCGPVIAQAVIQHLIDAGVLPKPQKDKFWLEWPADQDLSAMERADLSLKQAQAIGQYVSSGMSQYLTFTDFLVEFLGLERWKAEMLEENGLAKAKEMMEQEAAIAAAHPPEPGAQLSQTPGKPPFQPGKPPAPGKGTPPKQNGLETVENEGEADTPADSYWGPIPPASPPLRVEHGLWNQFAEWMRNVWKRGEGRTPSSPFEVGNEFNPDQPRDEQGRWAASASAIATKLVGYASEYTASGKEEEARKSQEIATLLREGRYQEANKAMQGHSLRYDIGKTAEQIDKLQRDYHIATTYGSDWGTKAGTYEAWRAGGLTSPRGVFFSIDRAGAQAYSGLHGGESAKSYRVTVERPLVSSRVEQAYADLTGKSLDQVYRERDRAKVVNDWFRRTDATVMKMAKAKGHDAIVYTDPAAPALREMVVWGVNQIEGKS